jgi:integrase
VRDTVRPTTFERYEQIVRAHTRPILERIRLKRLTPAHMRGLYREKLKGKLSPCTVQHLHVRLHKALKAAVAEGLITRNVTEAVKAPQVRREEMQPLSPEQAKTLFEAARGDRLEALYVLAVHTGVRQGELLRPKWDDVDLDDGMLQVRRADRGEGRPDPRRSQDEGQPPKLEAHPGCHRSPEKALGAPAKGEIDGAGPL